MNYHKGPGKDDGIPRDAAGETFYDRVRNVNAQLEAMETDFLRVAAEWQAEERPATEPDVTAQPDPTMPPLTPYVDQIVRLEREQYDHLIQMWIQFTSMGDQTALHHLFSDLVNPVLRALAAKAAEAGWFDDDNKEKK